MLRLLIIKELQSEGLSFLNQQVTSANLMEFLDYEANSRIRAHLETSALQPCREGFWEAFPPLLPEYLSSSDLEM